MKVCFQGFLGKNHSWSLVQQSIARSLVKKGHEVHLCSTNGYDHFPADLKACVKPVLEDKDYDMQLTYTAMHNFPTYLSHGEKNRFAIWNYETTIVPPAFIKYHKACDMMLPSSNFSKKIFADNGVPEEHMVVVPHGADLDSFAEATPYPLKTKKKVKILANIAQPHIRKNIPGLLEAFGRAFTKKDDVCLVAKVSVKKQVEAQFDVDFETILRRFKRKYPEHAEIELITHFIPRIADLYKSCDITFSSTFAECFWLPGIESMAAGNITIAPAYGGQLDFMNSDNSLLIPGKVVAAPREMQYWAGSPFAGMFEPNINEAAALLTKAYKECDALKAKFAPGMKQAIEVFSWDKVTDQIIGLCK